MHEAIVRLDTTAAMRPHAGLKEQILGVAALNRQLPPSQLAIRAGRYRRVAVPRRAHAASAGPPSICGRLTLRRPGDGTQIGPICATVSLPELDSRGRP